MPSNTDMRLAGICGDCIKRLGVDERLTLPLDYIDVPRLQVLDAKSLSGIQFPGHLGLGRGSHHGTTKITYKIAKTVKESIDDAASHTSHGSTKSSEKH